MKITKMTYFVKGIVDVLLSLLVVCVIIKTHDDLLPRSIIAIMLLCVGIFEIVVSIETKAQRLRKKEEAKLKRAQLHIMTLKKENEQLRAYNTDLESKYCRALKKVGIYRKWLEETGGVEKIEALPSSGKSGREA